MSEEIVPKNDKKKEEENSIELLPPEERVRKIQSQMIAAFSSGRKSDKSILFEKMSPENITQYLTGMEENDKRQFADSKDKRRIYMIYVVIGLISFGIAVIYLLPKDKDLLLQFIGMLVSFGGGFGIGRGYKDSDEN